MAKLPDEQSLGGRPAPRAARGISAPAVAGVQRGANLQAQYARDLNFRPLVNAAVQIATVQERIQGRDDAVRRAREFSAYKETVNAEFRRVQTEEDPMSDEVDTNFKTFLKEQKETALNEHKGSPDSRARFAVRLEDQQSTFAGEFAALRVKSKQDAVTAIMNTEMSSLADSVYENPGTLANAYDRLDDFIADWADIWTPEQEEAFRTDGRSMLYEATLDSLLDKGAWQGALELMNDMPGFEATMTEPAKRRVRARIGAAREAAQKGEPLELKIVADESSPTGRRYVTEEEAIGMPAPAPQPTHVYMGPKELAKLDAQRVDELNTSSVQARRDLDEITRMSAAIESGRAQTGVFVDARMFLARLAEYAGFDTSGETWQQLVGEAATFETLDAASNRLAVGIAQKLGRITNMSLMFVRDSLPNLTRTPEGNKILLEVMERASNRTIEISALADKYIQQYGELRPKGAKTFFEAVRQLDEEDPVITPKLRERIMKGGQEGPETWKKVLTKVTDDEPPTGFEAPEGWKFLRMEGDVAIITDGKRTARQVVK